MFAKDMQCGEMYVFNSPQYRGGCEMWITLCVTKNSEGGYNYIFFDMQHSMLNSCIIPDSIDMWSDRICFSYFPPPPKNGKQHVES
jgi:hypothetical protein